MTGALAVDDTANPSRMQIAACSCAKTKMDANWPFALFICSAVCAEKAKKGRKKCRVWVRSCVERLG